MTKEKHSTGTGVPPGEGQSLRPTIVKPPAAGSRDRKQEAPPATRPVAPAVVQPTIIPGVRRERIEASASEIQVLSPGASVAVCGGAVRLLEAVAMAKMNERKAVLWGHELQKSYGDKVTATLALAQDPLIEQARGYVDRMMELLGAMDLMAVCGHGKKGILDNLTKSMNRKIDTPVELARALEELQLLLDRMSASIGKLLEFSDRLRQHSSAIERIEGDVEAAALAALFLSNRFAGEAPELAQRFTERAMSLTATVVQVRQSNQVHQIQIEQPLLLIGAIQSVALVTLPGFIAGMASLLILAKTKGVSPTEASDMSYQLREILNQLKI